MNKDRKETTKYLHDLNEQTPLKCLTINYIDQVRAVLNYGFLALDYHKESDNHCSNIPNDNNGSSGTGTGGGGDNKDDDNKDNNKDDNNKDDDTPTTCEASTFTPTSPNKTLLTADAPDDGNSYGILITAMIRTKEQEALLHHVINAKTGAENYADNVVGSWSLLVKMFISSMNLPNLGENDDIHTNPTAYNKDWFTRLNVAFEADWSTYAEDENSVVVPITISGIDTNNKHTWGEGVHDSLKEPYDLNYGHTFIQDPDTITITRATREEQDAYLRIGDEYSTIPNSIYQAMNIVKRVDLIDVINSGNDITIKSCLKVVPDESATKPEPSDKDADYIIIENTSEKIYHGEWSSSIELNTQEEIHLVLLDLKVGEELTVELPIDYKTEFSLIPEEMGRDDLDNWKSRGLRKEIFSLKFIDGDYYNIKANIPMENGTDTDITHFSLIHNPHAQKISRIGTIKFIRVSPNHLLVKLTGNNHYNHNFILGNSNHLNSTDYEKGFYIFNNETIGSFTLKLKNFYRNIYLNKTGYFQPLKNKVISDIRGKYPFIKWTSSSSGVSKYNFIKGYLNSGQTETDIHKCELRTGMHFLIDTSYYKGSGATLTFGIESVNYPNKEIENFTNMDADNLENPFIEVSFMEQLKFDVDGRVTNLSALDRDKLCITTSVHHILPIWVLVKDTGQVFEYPND